MKPWSGFIAGWAGGARESAPWLHSPCGIPPAAEPVQHSPCSMARAAKVVQKSPCRLSILQKSLCRLSILRPVLEEHGMVDNAINL